MGLCPETDDEPEDEYRDGVQDWMRRTKDAAPEAWEAINGLNGILDQIGGMGVNALKNLTGGGATRGAGSGGGGGGRGRGDGGDLTPWETKQIQDVVDDTGRGVSVFGSAADGRRRGIGTDLPLGKGPGTKSDIDYRCDPDDLVAWQPHWHRLPDCESGVMPDVPYPGEIPFPPSR